MDLAGWIEPINNVLDSRYSDVAIEVVSQSLPYALAFLGSAFGARWGFSKYRKSEEYKFREQREYEAWQERQKVALPAEARQELKDYFNRMVQALSSRDKNTAGKAIEAVPESVLKNLKKSDVIHRNWKAYYEQIGKVLSLIEDKEPPGDTSHAWVKLFTVAKARWLVFMNSVSAIHYDGDEIYNLMDMGIVPRDFQSGRHGDSQSHAVDA